jgi:putative oligomerization/nucleic acid binding protein
MFRRRRVARAAVVGGVAYTAGKAGARSSAPAEQPGAEQQAAEPAPQEAVPSANESMDELVKLKSLLDSGALTQAEFDAQKQKILQTM